VIYGFYDWGSIGLLVDWGSGDGVGGISGLDWGSVGSGNWGLVP